MHVVYAVANRPCLVILLSDGVIRSIELYTAAGKVYHLAEAGAQSEPVRPLRPDGSPDTDVLARLVVRHDDSAENVANRLALWDRQVSCLQRQTDLLASQCEETGSDHYLLTYCPDQDAWTGTEEH
jgi:hypothetical protein